jgi:hypothetical protein
MLRNTRSKLMSNITLAVMTIVYTSKLFTFRYVSQSANKLKKYV